jgi:hypothetical protein
MTSIIRAHPEKRDEDHTGLKLIPRFRLRTLGARLYVSRHGVTCICVRRLGPVGEVTEMRLGKAALATSVCVMVSGTCLADRKAHEFYFQQNQQRFINPALDARMFSLGGSTALTTSNALSTSVNPAGLGLMRYGDLSATYSFNEVTGNYYPSGDKAKDKQNIGQVFGATPINPTRDGLPQGGNLGLGWFGRDGDWKYQSDNTETGTYQIVGAYGKSIGKTTSLGYGLTYQNDDVESDTHNYDSAESFLHTVGIQDRIHNDFTWGSTIGIGHGKHHLEHLSDLRQDQWVSQLSASIAGGMEYAVETTRVALGLDYVFMRNNGTDDPAANDLDSVFGGDSIGRAMNARVGVEEQVFDWMALRLGYRYAANFDWDYDRTDLSELSGSAKYSAYTGGIGVSYDFDDDSFIQALLLDYGVEYRDVADGDWQHMLTLSSPFDLCV